MSEERMVEVTINPAGQQKLSRAVVNTCWTPIRLLERVKTESYWLMRCRCGNERRITYRSYRTGTSLSCGCYRSAYLQNRRGSNRKPIGESARNQLMLIYRRGAARRGIAFELSREEFLRLTSSDCHYCGHPPHQVLDRGKLAPAGKNTVSAYIYNGVDRLENSVGYVVGNCVPCCRMCNYAKSDMAHADFIYWLDCVATFRAKKALS